MSSFISKDPLSKMNLDQFNEALQKADRTVIGTSGGRKVIIEKTEYSLNQLTQHLAKLVNNDISHESVIVNKIIEKLTQLDASKDYKKDLEGPGKFLKQCVLRIKQLTGNLLFHLQEGGRSRKDILKEMQPRTEESQKLTEEQKTGVTSSDKVLIARANKSKELKNELLSKLKNLDYSEIEELFQKRGDEFTQIMVYHDTPWERPGTKLILEDVLREIDFKLPYATVLLLFAYYEKSELLRDSNVNLLHFLVNNHSDKNKEMIEVMATKAIADYPELLNGRLNFKEGRDLTPIELAIEDCNFDLADKLLAKHQYHFTLSPKDKKKLLFHAEPLGGVFLAQNIFVKEMMAAAEGYVKNNQSFVNAGLKTDHETKETMLNVLRGMVYNRELFQKPKNYIAELESKENKTNFELYALQFFKDTVVIEYLATWA